MTKRVLPVSAAGFSLVEIMVGITIGLVTVLVASQVLVTSLERKRATASGADSMVNSTLALFTIERDVKNAGFGLTTVRKNIGCPVRARYGSNDRDFRLVPVVITDRADGGPDTIRVISSAKSNFSLPTRIITHTPSSATIFVESDLGVQDGDMMIAVPATLTASNWCTLFEATAPPTQGQGASNANGNAQGQNQVRHAPGQSEWNHDGGHNLFPPGGYAAGDYLVNLGSFIDRTYDISDHELVMTTRQMSNDTPFTHSLYPHVVQMQAVYGKDTDGDGDIEQWNADVPATLAAWRQIIAVRMALVVRSPTLENGNVTLDGENCDTASPPPTAVCWKPVPGANAVAINVNVDNQNPNWQRFRYRVMETTIPLRNAIWFQ